MDNPSPRESASASPETLTSTQLHALFDILTHHETYAEVESFKYPATISGYGYPFAQRCKDDSTSAPTYATDSSAPLLAGVLRSIVLSFPGIRDLPPEFWHVRFQGILEKLAEANLSESYDKGSLGTRKTLATAASSIHEAVSRGILGGVERREKKDLDGSYDRSQARDLERAWEDAVHELLYGDLIDELFRCAAERKSLEEHSSGVRAAVDYIIFHLATLLHHVFTLTSEGPYLLKLMDNVHKLLPYSMVKQTLRMGNAATMINGMMRLLLAKVGVGAISNWVGLTQDADDGMNLLQRIISMVLSWDNTESRKTVDRIEKSRGQQAASKVQLEAIKTHVYKLREEHDEARNQSLRTPESMVSAILRRSNPKLLKKLTEERHAEYLEYFSTLLMIRDREEIPGVLCRQHPDLFTKAVKDLVSAFEPFIRVLHEHADLREHVTAVEGFITDFINIGKSKSSRNGNGFLSSWTSSSPKNDADRHPPSVEDYVTLLQKNRQLLYNFLHQVASQCPNLTEDFRVWCNATIKVFQQSRQHCPSKNDLPPNSSTESPKSKKRHGGAGALSSNLQHLFTSLPPSERERILPAINAHASYLFSLEVLSRQRMQRILDNMPAAAADNDASLSPSTPLPASSTSNSGWSTPLSLGWYGGGGSDHYSKKLSPPPPPAASNNSLPSIKQSYSGPGMFLSRWQQLLDDTVIGPATLGGALRSGRDVKGELGMGKQPVTGARLPKDGGLDPVTLVRLAEEEAPDAPDVKVVVEVLGYEFRLLVGDILREDGRFATVVDKVVERHKCERARHGDKVEVLKC
ncbi:PX-associated-domain-containing protein [Triangularia verruculosa]|uniref:PX-associated-domain-containing protein n=1 Tax=Triangularia verruculosa TaxID=2587418 RepID=A0AAN6XFG9_9PEZI|nr:PX-associated-domain-containing protein [Triangularia verruculosa]